MTHQTKSEREGAIFQIETRAAAFGLRALLTWSVVAALVGCDPEGTIGITQRNDADEGSLRAAIAQANANGTRATRIELRTSGIYTLDRCDEGRGDLDLDTSAAVTLVAVAANVVIQQYCAGERVLEQHGTGTLRLLDVTVRGGSLAGASASGLQGGGIRASGDVQLERTIISNNSVRGANAASGAAAGQVVRGGGLYVGGSLDAIDSALVGNSAIAGAGAARSASDPGSAGGKAEGGGAYVARDVELERVTLASNSTRGGDANAVVAAGEANGAGIAAAGRVDGREIIALENTATGGSNPLLDMPGGATAGAARGGAISAAAATIASSTFTSNRVQSGNAFFKCDGRTLAGWVGCGGAAPSAARGSAVWAATALTIQSASFTQNAAVAGTGAVALPPPPGFPPVLLPSIPARAGGTAASGGSLTVNGAELRGNVAEHAPPNPVVIFSGDGEIAAGLSAATSATITAATLHDNTGPYGTPAIAAVDSIRVESSEVTGSSIGLRAASVDGKALTIAGSQSSSIAATGSVSLVNATFVNNGYGISGASLELRHSTITDNGAYQFLVRELTAHASFVGTASQQLCPNSVTVLSSSYNWFGDSSCELTGTGDRQESSEPLLAPLASNGGAVRTRSPASVSELVDAIPGGACAAELDARGVSRPQGAGCDIGAVELSAVPGVGPADLAVAFQNPPASVTPGTPLNLTLNLDNRGPGAAAPTLFIEVPDGVTPTSASASRNGTCTLGATVLCTWPAGLPSGTSATVSLIAGTATDLTGPVPIRARAAARALTGSTADDQAELSLDVSLQTGLRLIVQRVGVARVRLSLFNEGPSAAGVSFAEPIRVSFIPDPGVTVVTELSSTTDPVDYIYIHPIAVGETGYVGTFGVRPASHTQRRVGTLRVDPGINQLVGPAEIAATVSNLSISVLREPGVKIRGAPGSFTFEVRNLGSTSERDVTVVANTSFVDPEQPFTFAPDVGSVVGYTPTSDDFTWLIPSIEPGQVLRLKVSARHLFDDTFVNAQVFGGPFEFEVSNNHEFVDYGFTPLGTADLRVTSLDVRAANGEEMVISATITNAGPQAAGSSSGVPITVTPVQEFAALTPISAEASNSGWMCAVWACSATASLPVGASATFRFTVANTAYEPLSPFGVQVQSMTTVDHDLSNNDAFAHALP